MNRYERSQVRSFHAPYFHSNLRVDLPQNSGAKMAIDALLKVNQWSSIDLQPQAKSIGRSLTNHVRPLLSLVTKGTDSRIHPIFDLNTRTGRISIKKPDLQVRCGTYREFSSLVLRIFPLPTRISSRLKKLSSPLQVSPNIFGLHSDFFSRECIYCC